MRKEALRAKMQNSQASGEALSCVMQINLKYYKKREWNNAAGEARKRRG